MSTVRATLSKRVQTLRVDDTWALHNPSGKPRLPLATSSGRHGRSLVPTHAWDNALNELRDKGLAESPVDLGCLF